MEALPVALLNNNKRSSDLYFCTFLSGSGKGKIQLMGKWLHSFNEETSSQRVCSRHFAGAKKTDVNRSLIT